jgi:hypothetical protein
MKDKYDENNYRWNLTGEEINNFDEASATWYKTLRGHLIVLTHRNGDRWFSTAQNPGNKTLPYWRSMMEVDNEMPHDIIYEPVWDDFDLDDIELAEMIMKGEL